MRLRLDPSMLLLLDPRTEPYGRIFRHIVSPTVLRVLVARSRDHYRENLLAILLLAFLRDQAIREAETAPSPAILLPRLHPPYTDRDPGLTVGSLVPPPTKEPDA